MRRVCGDHTVHGLASYIANTLDTSKERASGRIRKIRWIYRKDRKPLGRRFGAMQARQLTIRSCVRPHSLHLDSCGVIEVHCMSGDKLVVPEGGAFGCGFGGVVPCPPW
jgi:hypothetical protein